MKCQIYFIAFLGAKADASWFKQHLTLMNEILNKPVRCLFYFFAFMDQIFCVENPFRILNAFFILYLDLCYWMQILAMMWEVNENEIKSFWIIMRWFRNGGEGQLSRWVCELRFATGADEERNLLNLSIVSKIIPPFHSF